MTRLSLLYWMVCALFIDHLLPTSLLPGFHDKYVMECCVLYVLECIHGTWLINEIDAMSHIHSHLITLSTGTSQYSEYSLIRRNLFPKNMAD